MTKLKTLKDFNNLPTIREGKFDDKVRNLIYVDELKAEAIKWVKSTEKIHFDNICSTNVCCIESVRGFIKHFFNLTEEDLTRKSEQKRILEEVKKTEKKKVLCSRCKRELDWEEKEMIRTMPRETLINIIFQMQEQLRSKK